MASLYLHQASNGWDSTVTCEGLDSLLAMCKASSTLPELTVSSLRTWLYSVKGSTAKQAQLGVLCKLHDREQAAQL